MKKIWLLLSLLAVSFQLSACSPQPSMSRSEMETLYQTQLQTFVENIQSFFPLNPSQPLHTETALELQTQNSLKGHLTYTSSKDSLAQDEKATHTFDVSLQSLSWTTPFLLSGIIDTLYTNQLMHFNIQQFNLFMGEGNAEVSFINLLAKDLTRKRVMLDKKEKFWISIIETPELSSFIADMAQLFRADETTQPSTSTETPSTETLLPITSLSAQHLSSAQRIYDVLIQLLNLPLTVEGLTQDTTTGSTLAYQTQTKTSVSMAKMLHYRTATHTFAVQLSSTPKQLSLLLDSIVNLANPETTLPDSYIFTLTPKNATTFTLTAEQYQNQQLQRNLKTEILLQKKDTTTQIQLQGNLQVPTYLINPNEHLLLRLQGTQTLTPTSQPDFSLSWEVITLSDII